jgi:hypothetical protein
MQKVAVLLMSILLGAVCSYACTALPGPGPAHNCCPHGGDPSQQQAPDQAASSCVYEAGVVHEVSRIGDPVDVVESGWEIPKPAHLAPEAVSGPGTAERVQLASILSLVSILRV